MLVLLVGCAWIDAATLRDGDGDGVPVWEDCDDGSKAVERPRDLFADADGDGLGGEAVVACDGVEEGGDCDDGDATVGGPTTWWADADEDGFAGEDGTDTCSPPPGGGWTDTPGTDCDDSDAAVHPHALEACDAIDQDCDGRTDECDAQRLGLRFTGAPDEAVGLWAPAWADLDADGDDELMIPAVYALEIEVVDGGPHAETSAPLDSVATTLVYDLLGDGGAVAAGELDGDAGLDVAYARAGNGGEYSVGLRWGTNRTTDPDSYVPGESPGDELGWSLAVEDYDGDGKADILAGAPFQTGGCGAAYLFYGPFTAPDYTANARYNSELGARFPTACRPGDTYGLGLSVAVLHDDAGPAALVFGHPSYLADTGAVYVWHGEARPTGDHDLHTDVDTVAPDVTRWLGADVYTDFGQSIATADLDGDGIDELLVGATFGAGGSGSVYVLEDAATNLEAPLTSANMVAGEDGYTGTTGFGYRIAVMPDVDGDGLPEVAVSAPVYTPAAGVPEAGAVYLFHDLMGVTDAADAEERMYADEALAWFGSSLSAGDLDGDGLPELAIGIAHADDGAGEVRVRLGTDPW